MIERITIFLNSQQEMLLERLIETGLYGSDLSEAAERVINRELERQLTEGLLLPEEENDRGF